MRVSMLKTEKMMAALGPHLLPRAWDKLAAGHGLFRVDGISFTSP